MLERISAQRRLVRCMPSLVSTKSVFLEQTITSCTISQPKKGSQTMRERRTNRIKRCTKNQRSLECKQIRPLLNMWKYTRSQYKFTYINPFLCICLELIFFSPDFAPRRNFHHTIFLGRFMGHVYSHPTFIFAYSLSLSRKNRNNGGMEKLTTRNCINNSGIFRTGNMQTETRMCVAQAVDYYPTISWTLWINGITNQQMDWKTAEKTPNRIENET